MKEVYLGTIRGITTLTQLALYVCYSRFYRNARWLRRVIPKMHNPAGSHVDPRLLNSEDWRCSNYASAGVLFLRLVILESQRFRGRLGTCCAPLPH